MSNFTRTKETEKTSKYSKLMKGHPYAEFVPLVFSVMGGVDDYTGELIYKMA